MAKSSYLPTIGLEIHAELKTLTKMFCASKNDPHASTPNTHVCPICLAYPGTLPVINKQAVHHVLRVGAALQGTLADYTEFDRKNYFYPDLPKGYQLSQYKYPLVSGGSLRGVKITRVHLEEDTARSQHAGEWSLVDYNRAGVPLMELVTDPVIHDAKTASLFAQELQLLLKTLGVSDANMEKGEMRVEANISVSQDSNVFGTKVEVKNLNSFKAVEKAIDFEVARHIQVLESGGTLIQETRGWDEHTEKTFSQRTKENSEEYRYFPDPDLPKLYLSRVPGFSLAEIQETLPELPWVRRDRYRALGIKDADAEVLVVDSVFGAFFEEEILSKNKQKDYIQTGVNYLLSDIRGSHATSLDAFRNGVFYELIDLLIGKKVSSRGAKDILNFIAKNGGRPQAIAEEQGVLQVDDVHALNTLVHEVINEHASVGDDYRAGKASALQFLIGQGMKKSKGSANPETLAMLFKKELIKE